MADIDVGAGALGARLGVHVKAVPPSGWVGAVALAAVVVLAWHYWDQDVEDTTSWTDPEQPPMNLVMRSELPSLACPMVHGLDAMRGRRSPGAMPGAC